MARIAHHRITPKVVQEIRSFRKETVSVQEKRVAIYLWAEPETHRWLMIVAQKIGVKRDDIVRYFINEKLKEPATSIMRPGDATEIVTKCEDDTRLKDVLRRVRQQNPDSKELTIIYVPLKLYERIDTRTIADEWAFGEFVHFTLIRSIKE